jgi:hypothetical protein
MTPAFAENLLPLELSAKLTRVAIVQHSDRSPSKILTGMDTDTRRKVYYIVAIFKTQNKIFHNGIDVIIIY